MFGHDCFPIALDVRLAGVALRRSPSLSPPNYPELLGRLVRKLENPFEALFETAGTMDIRDLLEWTTTSTPNCSKHEKLMRQRDRQFSGLHRSVNQSPCNLSEALTFLFDNSSKQRCAASSHVQRRRLTAGLRSLCGSGPHFRKCSIAAARETG
jgi:hypothetical protein